MVFTINIKKSKQNTNVYSAIELSKYSEMKLEMSRDNPKF